MTSAHDDPLRQIEGFFDRETSTVSCLVPDRASHRCAVIHRLLPSVQVNLYGAALPEPEGNRVRHLEIPLDAP